MSGTKLYSFKSALLIALMLTVSIFSSCSKDEGDAVNDGADDSIKLDYSVHPITENLKWLTNNDEPLIA